MHSSIVRYWRFWLAYAAAGVAMVGDLPGCDSNDNSISCRICDARLTPFYHATAGAVVLPRARATTRSSRVTIWHERGAALAARLLCAQARRGADAQARRLPRLNTVPTTLARLIRFTPTHAPARHARYTLGAGSSIGIGSRQHKHAGRLRYTSALRGHTLARAGSVTWRAFMNDAAPGTHVVRVHLPLPTRATCAANAAYQRHA